MVFHHLPGGCRWHQGTCHGAGNIEADGSGRNRISFLCPSLPGMHPPRLLPLQQADASRRRVHEPHPEPDE